MDCRKNSIEEFAEKTPGYFIVVSVLFMVSMLVLRGLNDEAGDCLSVMDIPMDAT